jgi:hypothetical protein
MVFLSLQYDCLTTSILFDRCIAGKGYDFQPGRIWKVFLGYALCYEASQHSFSHSYMLDGNNCASHDLYSIPFQFCDYGIEGVVPQELLPPEVRSKFYSKPGDKAKRPKREDPKGTSAQPKEQQVLGSPS